MFLKDLKRVILTLFFIAAIGLLGIHTALAQTAPVPFYSITNQHNLILGPYDGSGSMREPVLGSVYENPVVTPAGDMDGDGVINELDLFDFLEIQPPNHVTRDLDRDGLPGDSYNASTGSSWAGCPRVGGVFITGDQALDAFDFCENENLGYNRRSDIAFEVIRRVLDLNDDNKINYLDDQRISVRLGFMAFHTALWNGTDITYSSNLSAAERTALAARYRVPVLSRNLTQTTDPITGCKYGQTKLRYYKSLSDPGSVSNSSTHKVYEGLNAVSVLTLASQTSLERSLDFLRTEVWPYELDGSRLGMNACSKNFQILITDGIDNCAQATGTQAQIDQSERDQTIQAAGYLYNSTWDPLTSLTVPQPAPLPNPQTALGGENGGALGGFYVQTYVVGAGQLANSGHPHDLKPDIILTLHRTARAGGTDANSDLDNDPNTACVPDATDPVGNPGVHVNLVTLAPTGYLGIDCSGCKVPNSSGECFGTAYFGSNIPTLTASLRAILDQVNTGEYAPHRPILRFSSASTAGIWLTSEEVGVQPYRFSNVRYFDLIRDPNDPNLLTTSLLFNATNQESTPPPGGHGIVESQVTADLISGSPCTTQSPPAVGNSCKRSLAFDGSQPSAGSVAGEDLISADEVSSQLNAARLNLASLPESEVADCNNDGSRNDQDVACILKFARNDQGGGAVSRVLGFPSSPKRQQDMLPGLTETKPVLIGPPNQFGYLALGQNFDKTLVARANDPRLFVIGAGDGLHGYLESDDPTSGYLKGREAWTIYPTDDAVIDLPYLRLNERLGANGQCDLDFVNTSATLQDARGDTNGDNWRRVLTCSQGSNLFALDLTDPIRPTTFGYVDLDRPELGQGDITMQPLLGNVAPDPNAAVDAAGSIQAPIVFVGGGQKGVNNKIYAYQVNKLADALSPVWSSPTADSTGLPGQPDEISDLMGFTKGDCMDRDNNLFVDTCYFLTRGGLIFRLGVTNIGDTANWSWKLVYINRDNPDLTGVPGGTGTSGDGVYNYNAGAGGEDEPANPGLDLPAQDLTIFLAPDGSESLLVTFGQDIFSAPTGNEVEQLRWLQYNGTRLLENQLPDIIDAQDPDPDGSPDTTWDQSTDKPITLLAGKMKFISPIELFLGRVFFQIYDTRSLTPCGKGRTITVGFNLRTGDLIDLDNNSASDILVINEVVSPPLMDMETGNLFLAYQEGGEFKIDIRPSGLAGPKKGLISIGSRMF